jgi:tetratricopeptide (TPR) repeat protein
LLGGHEDLFLVDRSAREARTLDADPAVQADLYQTLGKIYQNLGKFDRAGELLQSALDRSKNNSHLSENLLAMGLLRLSKEGEAYGLDLHEHGISAYPEYVIAAAAQPAGMIDFASAAPHGAVASAKAAR